MTVSNSDAEGVHATPEGHSPIPCLLIGPPREFWRFEACSYFDRTIS
jgi:hypothetical protein